MAFWYTSKRGVFCFEDMVRSRCGLSQAAQLPRTSIEARRPSGIACKQPYRSARCTLQGPG